MNELLSVCCSATAIGESDFCSACHEHSGFEALHDCADDYSTEEIDGQYFATCNTCEADVTEDVNRKFEDAKMEAQDNG